MVLQEAVAVDIDHAPVQRAFRGIRDRVQQEIELAPFLPDPFEHLFHLAFGVDVERHEDRRFQHFGKRFDMLPGTLVQIGDGEIGSQRAKRLGAAPGDRLIVGDADDQSLLSFQSDAGIRDRPECS